MFGLGNLLKVIILLVNAIAILSEDRFLARIGWSAQPTGMDAASGFGGGVGGQMGGIEGQSIKVKIINLISAVRLVMRIPLIGINLVLVLYELVLG
ncbi:Yos1-like protein [Ascobolus immersus RN42]|uniref:Yos1-like protein n=1 Tax=Ascobolus immersus RN42 TaxID=1160509 RepID=A0A3N4IBY6_ASCIM|nr:Yos1-like protein [Ascobolus immersus RN42]